MPHRDVEPQRVPAELAAARIEEGFDRFHDAFRAITRQAARRFAARDWRGIRDDTVRRLELYGESVAATLERLGPLEAGRRSWVATREAYAARVRGRDDFELALTFFNSISRRRCRRRGVDPEIEFLATDLAFPYRGLELAAARSYAVREVEAPLIERLLADADLGAPLADPGGDAALVTARLSRACRDAWGDAAIDSLDVLRAPFYRNKGAYLVGRVRRGERHLPVVLALLHGPRGVNVDALLTSEDDVSILFSFARWYFHTAVDSPRPVIGFLHSILPRKRIAELYIAIGHQRHGKTELYADLMEQVRRADDLFAEAPGAPGTVMSVFTHPRLELVFKVIRDTFPAQKETSPQRIRDKYRLVLRHDRVGRLVDYQEFEGLALPRDRFPPELLAALLAEAGQRVRLEGDEVVFRHLYVGRRVVPLDVWLARDLPRGDEEAVVDDWGRALEDLAAAGLFAGDILRKNFGVTRHGRVVFYDYDEILPLDACRFRALPTARDDRDEMAAEPWFPVHEGDVFPEELARFFDLSGDLRRCFERRHGGMFTVAWWRERQERVARQELIDFFPYPEDRRLRPDEPPAAAASS